MAGRAMLIALSAGAIVWLGIWLHQARQFDDARSAALTPGSTRSAASVDRVVGMFRAARGHTPDTLPLTAEALFLLRAGQRQRAVAPLESALRREPSNVTAWGLLSFADPARAAQARAKIAQLDPLGARTR
jgi:Flp pilus assembly protein TadD